MKTKKKKDTLTSLRTEIKRLQEKNDEIRLIASKTRILYNHILDRTITKRFEIEYYILYEGLRLSTEIKNIDALDARHAEAIIESLLNWAQDIEIISIKVIA